MFRRALPLWPRDGRRILKALRRHSAPLRIILKTRNDPIFLAEWHRHHAAIVGAENLIIADNMSDDPQVQTLLKELARQSTVFRFDAFHDTLHKRELFRPFYAALEETCAWSILLDTDERLAWMEGQEWIADHRLVDRLTDLAPDAPALPGLLIENLPGLRDRLSFPTARDRLASVLHWGKPAIASGHGLPVSGAQCHNIQFPEAMFRSGVPPRLVAMHLCNLHPEQRLRANREKLAARGICAPHTPYEEIARLDVRHETRSVIRRCVLETRRLIAPAQEGGADGPALILHPDGRLGFSGGDVAQSFACVQDEGAALLRAALSKDTPSRP